MTRNRPYIIGLTGGSGVGKGEAAKIFAALRPDAQIIDADRMAHQAILSDKPGYNEVVAVFGREILGPDGEIARKKLGAIVFADKNKLALLSRIVHKYVRRECEEIFERTHSKIVVVDAAALVEAGMDKLCDVVVGVFAPAQMRIERIMHRDGIGFDAAAQRIASQMKDEELKRFVKESIMNDGGLAELAEKLRELLERKGL